jgi:hypothetical protein
MSSSINLIRYARTGFLSLLDGLTAEQMNTVPKGFNNNLIWNLAHAIAVQQALCYKRTNNTPVADEKLIETYQKGTVPETPVPAAEIEHIKKLAMATIDQLQVDYDRNLFASYPSFTVTSQNLPVNNINNALEFVVFHEGLHFGYAQSLKRAVLSA